MIWSKKAHYRFTNLKKNTTQKIVIDHHDKQIKFNAVHRSNIDLISLYYESNDNILITMYLRSLTSSSTFRIMKGTGGNSLRDSFTTRSVNFNWVKSAFSRGRSEPPNTSCNLARMIGIMHLFFYITISASSIFIVL